MSQILEGLDGVVCMMDDALVYECTTDEHDSCLMSILDKIKASGFTLNEDKYQFSRKSIKYFGNVTDCTGIHPDSEADAEPLLSTPFPQLLWQKVGTDLLTWKSSNTS